MDRDFVFAIGDLIEWTFGILRVLGNNFNWVIIVVIFIMAVLWIRRMGQYNREARERGTLK